MQAEKIKAALEALKNQDAEAALVLLEELIASEAGAGDDPGDGGTEELSEEVDPDEEGETTELSSESGDDEETKAMSALMRVMGAKNPGEAAQNYKELSAKVAQIEADRLALEDNERLGLVADLVKLGFETPATAWSPLSEKEEKLEEGGKTVARKPCKRLAAEPIGDLRERVKALRSSRPQGIREVQAPTNAAVDVSKLSRKELAACKKRGIDPKDYAERKANAVRRD